MDYSNEPSKPDWQTSIGKQLIVRDQELDQWSTVFQDNEKIRTQLNISNDRILYLEKAMQKMINVNAEHSKDVQISQLTTELCNVQSNINRKLEVELDLTTKIKNMQTVISTMDSQQESHTKKIEHLNTVINSMIDRIKHLEQSLTNCYDDNLVLILENYIMMTKL